MARLNLFDFIDGVLAPSMPGMYFESSISEYEVVENSQDFKLMRQADGILHDLRQRFDPGELHRDLVHLGTLFPHDHVRKYLEENHVHLSVLAVMQHFPLSLGIQQTGFKLLSLFATKSLVLRKNMSDFDLYTFLLRILTKNLSDTTIQESGMNILFYVLASDVLQMQLSREDKSCVLGVIINTVSMFRDNSVVLLTALSALNTLLKKDCVQDMFVQQHIAIILECFDANKDKPKIALGILNILQDVAVNVSLQKELIDNGIHIKVFSYVEQADVQTLSPCLNILLTLNEHVPAALSNILEHLVLQCLIPRLLTHSKVEDVQVSGLRMFHAAAAPVLQNECTSAETALGWLKVIYTAMHKHMDKPRIQTIACECLSRILVYQSDACRWIGDGANPKADPLHTVCLGVIIMYRRDPEVFTAAADAIYHLAADNDRLCKNLMEKNAHIALIGGLTYHLKKYCHAPSTDIFASALAAGCRALRGLIIFHDDHKLSVGEQEEIPKLLSMVLKECPDEETVQCEAISTLACLADIDTIQHLCFIEGVHYHVIEAFTHFPDNAILQEAAIEALAVLGGAASGAMILNDIGATGIVLQVLKKFPDNINIQKKGLMAVQILAEKRLVETKKLCEDLTDAISSVMTGHRSTVSILREAVVAMNILAEKSHLMSEVLIERGCHEILFQILETYDENQGLHDLASECLYVIGCVQNLKSRMLLSACDKGYLAGVECLVEIGADINIGQGHTTPLFFAVKNKDDNMVKFLLQQEVRDLQTSLQLSLKQETHIITGMLLSKIGQDKQGGTVLWGGFGLGDLQPEWFLQALTTQITSHSTSRAGLHLVEKLKKGGEMRKSRISYSPSDSQIELSKHCNFRFRRCSSDTSGKLTYSQEKQGLTFSWTSRQNSDSRSRKVIQNQKTKALKVSYNGKSSPDSDVPSTYCPASWDYQETKSPENQNSGEDDSDSVFDHTLDEWEEWKQNTLTGANIPFSPSDPRKLQSGATYHHYTNKTWLRKYSLQSSTDGQEQLSLSGSISLSQPNPADVVPSSPHTNTSAHRHTDSEIIRIGDPLFSPDYGLTSSYNRESVSSDTDFEISQDSFLSSSRTNRSLSSSQQSQHSEFLITYLDVSANQIESLDNLAGTRPSFMEHFSALERLDLHNNNLQSLPDGIFEYLPKLQNLILRENRLAAFPREVMVCPMLHSLDISSNKISHIGKVDFGTVSHSLRRLDLDSNGIMKFPSVLHTVMPDLEHLSLAKNNLKSLEGCSLKLPKLKELILSHNEIESIPDSFLSTCQKLETLEALNNKLTCLPHKEVSKCLPRLYTLKLSTNLLTEKAPFYIPKFILELPSLRTVDLSDNILDGLPPPAMWKSQILKNIMVSRNKISKLNLDGVKSWAKVEKFHIKANKLTELPKDIGHMSSLESFDISHNKMLTTLPDELGRCSKIWEMPLDGLNLDLDDSLLKGNKSDLIMYLHNRLKKARPYYRIKLMVIGYGGRGKSTLLQALRKPKQKQQPELTVGVIVEDWKYERSHSGKTVLYTVSTWDFAGQEEFYSTHQCFLSNRAVYLVVYDITKGPGEIDLLKRWLSNIFSRVPGCPVIVVGTHYDQLTQEMCDEYVPQIKEKLYDLMQKPGFPEIKWSTEVDCTCENPEVKQLRSVVKEIIDDYRIKGQPVMGQKRPASYVRLAELLSREVERQMYPVIKHPELKQMVKDERLDLEEDEELHQAVRFLHEGGVLLHYNETALMLRNFYFIDPGWLCQMMAKFVTIPMKNPFISPDGTMEKKSVKKLFEDKTFPLELIDQYLRLLEKFEIALPRNDTQLLIPCRFPIEKPCFTVPNLEKIHRFYSMPYSPLGFWSRLIARLIVFSKSHVTETWLSLSSEPSMEYWREGIFVLWSEKAFFLVDNNIKVDSEDLHIMVPATLPGYQLLGFLVDHLDALIDEWYPGLTTLDPLKGRELLDKYVPCIRCDSSSPHEFQFHDLLNQSDMENTDDVIRCPVHGGDVLLAELAPDIMLLDVEERFRMNVDELEFNASPENLLGDGGFGSVYRAIYKNQVVAAKVFNPLGDVHPHKLLRQEATVLRRLQHPSVISLLAVGLRPCRIVVLEFASLGTLTQILKSEKNLSKVLQHRIALQIAEGLEYLHALMIVFRDLKPDNILMFSLSPSDLINAKISDYGISQFTTLYGLTAQEGTPAYRAPEVIRRETYSFQADVFAFGILLYILLTGGCHPHEELKSRSDMDRAFADNSPIQLITQRGKPPWPDMHDLVRQCLHQIPDDRPKTDEIVQRLRSAELFSLKQWYPISVGTTVECMTYQMCENDLTKVWVASGNNEHMELSRLNLQTHCGCVDLQHKLQAAWKTSASPVGRSLGEGRILSILSVDSEHVLLGTQMGKISVFDTAKFEVIHSTIQLGDSVISLHLCPRQDDPMVLGGLANGVLVFYPLSELLQKPVHYPLCLNLGSKHEPIRCMVQMKNKVLASCGTRIFILNTKHGLAIENICDTVDNGLHHLAPTPPKSLHLPLHRSSPGLFGSSCPSLTTRGPAHGHSWDGCQWHSADVSNPFPSAAFNFERDGLHACPFMEFLVGDFVLPIDAQNPPEAFVLENFQHLANAFSDLP
ncbi:leucine-rich repeat serine/threonine-protein kinase 2-like isoform X2 [Gigantopelta aegis]|uniref:leucine-rich repeat serine/threonine-protein kinase 2-like isoform X2 n=1 Tax=Gigantopelta aegis TaxID=1735272 RepID=UPI001B88A8E1|nr:leucine-rich repeat serine/threonine-protein kinase 2-like isoform X2 [Gigantopelta aegis]